MKVKKCDPCYYILGTYVKLPKHRRVSRNKYLNCLTVSDIKKLIFAYSYILFIQVDPREKKDNRTKRTKAGPSKGKKRGRKGKTASARQQQ